MTSKQPEKTNTRTIAALGNFSAMNIIIVIINLHDTCNDRHRKNVYDAWHIDKPDETSGLQIQAQLKLTCNIQYIYHTNQQWKYKLQYTYYDTLIWQKIYNLIGRF